MRKILTLLIFVFVNHQANAQKKVQLQNLSNKFLKSILCNLDTTVVKSNNNIAVRYYLISNPSGSAKLPESDEVSNQLIFAVSTIDDDPVQHLYKTQRFINPRIISFSEINIKEFDIIIEYGIYNARKRKTFKITESTCIELR